MRKTITTYITHDVGNRLTRFVLRWFYNQIFNASWNVNFEFVDFTVKKTTFV